MRRFWLTLLLSGTLSVAAEAKDWFEASSEHFTVVSNGSKGRAEDVLEDLERLRHVVTLLLPAQKVDGTKPAVFYLFDDEKSMRPFQPVIDGEREAWAGMYRPTPLRDVVLIRADRSREEARSLAFGQFTHLLESYSGEDYPVWLSNGLARFYGNADISDKRAQIGKMRQEYRTLLAQYRSIPIRDLFAVDHASELYRDLGKRDFFDAQSWALVHYLLIGQAADGGAERLGRYIAMLRRGSDPLLAFEEAMGKSAAAIDAEVASYLRKSIAQYIQVELPPVETSEDLRIEELDETAVAAHQGRLYVVTGYEDEAEESLTRAIEARPSQIVAYEAMANLRSRQGRSAEASGFLERAIRNGSTNPHVHLRWAQLFANAHDGDPASLTDEVTSPVLESLELVLREAPELTDAARLFGFLSLFRDGSTDEAFDVVTAALERDPRNPSLLFMVGQLHAKNGSYAAARTVFRSLLRRDLEPGFEASVRRQLDHADARVQLEAQRAAAARAEASGETANAGEAVPAEETEDPDAVPNGVLPGTRDSRELGRVFGKLTQFDCADGFRFVVEANGVVYRLQIDDLARVEILENGETVGTRDFYCGPLDHVVTVRYVPAPLEPGSSERRGTLVSVDFMEGQ